MDASSVPPKLERAYSRLLFTPSYVVVGVYRLLSDEALYMPAWNKCKHGVVRGATVGFVWTCLTFRLQRKLVELFYMKSPRVTGLAETGFFGYHLPISVSTYAAIFFVGSQLTVILTFFLSRNLRVARERAYAQTVASRGKGDAFWQAYVEEHVNPPRVDAREQRWTWDRMFSTFVGRMFLKNVVLAPLNFVPVVGILVSAWLKALGTARYLHRPYFAAKKMTPQQIAVFVEERKWEYRAFGLAAAVLEGLPVVGLVFTISNRIGAAMWAHDLEKNQHFVAEQLGQGRSLADITGRAPRPDVHLSGRVKSSAISPQESVELKPLRRDPAAIDSTLPGVNIPGGF